MHNNKNANYNRTAIMKYIVSPINITKINKLGRSLNYKNMRKQVCYLYINSIGNLCKEQVDSISEFLTQKLVEEVLET